MLKWWQSALLVTVGLAIAFAAGRYSKPARVEVREHETIRTVQDTSAQRRVSELAAQLDELKTHQHTDRVVITRPGGVRIVHVVTDTDTQRVEVQQAEINGVTQVTQHVAEVQTVERSQITERAHDWSVGALLWTDTGRLFRDPLGSLSAGIEVDRRVLGPIYLGVSATVTVQRPVSWPTVGLTVGVSF